MWGQILGGAALGLGGALFGGGGQGSLPFSVSNDWRQKVYGLPTMEAIRSRQSDFRNPKNLRPENMIPFSGRESQRAGALEQIPQLQQFYDSLLPMMQAQIGGYGQQANSLFNNFGSQFDRLDNEFKRSIGDIDKQYSDTVSGVDTGLSDTINAIRMTGGRIESDGKRDVLNSLANRGLGSSTLNENAFVNQIMPARMQYETGAIAGAKSEANARKTAAGLTRSQGMSQLTSQRQNQRERTMQDMFGRLLGHHTGTMPGLELGTLLPLMTAGPEAQFNTLANPGAIFADPYTHGDAFRGSGGLMQPGNQFGANLGGMMGNIGGMLMGSGFQGQQNNQMMQMMQQMMGMG